MRRSFNFVEIRTGDTRHIQQIHIDQPYMHPNTIAPIFKSLSLNACNNPSSVWMKIYFDHQLYLVFHLHIWELDRLQTSYHDRFCIFIQLMYNINHHLAKWSIFIRCVVCSLACTTPPPPPPPTHHLDPRRPLHVLHMFIAKYHCPKGILGLRGDLKIN